MVILKIIIRLYSLYTIRRIQIFLHQCTEPQFLILVLLAHIPLRLKPRPDHFKRLLIMHQKLRTEGEQLMNFSHYSSQIEVYVAGEFHQSCQGHTLIY